MPRGLTRHGDGCAEMTVHDPCKDPTEGVNPCVHIVPGGVFPDYELPDHTKTMRRLSDLQGDDPLILTLARGHYCPKEHQQPLQLAAFSPQIGVG
jgi:hypothetical protein